MRIGDDTPLGIKDDKSGVSGSSVYSFKPNLTGQGVYLVQLCDEEGIKAKMEYGRVRIFAASKISRFKELITQSVKDYSPENRELIHPVHMWSNNAGHFCVIFNYKEKEPVLHTYESAFSAVVCHQYVGVIPRVKKSIIHSSKDEMRGALTAMGVFIK